MDEKTRQNTCVVKDERLKEKAVFLSQYASVLMGSGGHTSRVIRNTKRIGEVIDIDVKVSGFHKSLMLSAISKKSGERFNILEEIPSCPISFEINTNLSRLSWDAHDNHWSFEEIKKRFSYLMEKPKLHPVVVLILSSFANASFCALFGGDWFSMCIVFSATLIGMSAKQKMLKKKVNPFLTFVFCSFLASMVASTSVIFNTTSETALATSVLYLIPGVPLINGFMDMMEGHVVTGSARLINAFLLILCIAIGLSGTLFIIKNKLL